MLSPCPSTKTSIFSHGLTFAVMHEFGWPVWVPVLSARHLGWINIRRVNMECLFSNILLFWLKICSVWRTARVNAARAVSVIVKWGEHKVPWWHIINHSNNRQRGQQGRGLCAADIDELNFISTTEPVARQPKIRNWGSCPQTGNYCCLC